MFADFADQACTTKIYTHKLNIACMHATEKLLFREIPIRKNLSNSQSAKVYTLEIYPAIRHMFLCNFPLTVCTLSAS